MTDEQYRGMPSASPARAEASVAVGRDAVGAMFGVLAEPSRRQILDLLVRRERSVGELVERLSITQPAVSKHLRILRDAGVVVAKVAGQRRLYDVAPQAFSGIDEWLQPYRRRWDVALDALERRLDEMPADTPHDTPDDSKHNHQGRRTRPTKHEER
jgi:DNA-binding transcriptional ArsR family regulator